MSGLHREQTNSSPFKLLPLTFALLLQSFISSQGFLLLVIIWDLTFVYQLTCLEHQPLTTSSSFQAKHSYVCSCFNADKIMGIWASKLTIACRHSKCESHHTGIGDHDTISQIDVHMSKIQWDAESSICMPNNTNYVHD